MSISEKDIDLIDGHLKEQLNSTEKQLFDDRLRSETEFAALVQDMKLAREAIRRNALNKKHTELQALERSLPKVNTEEQHEADQPHKNNIRRILNKWSVAAGFLLIILAGSTLFLNRASSPEEIYQQYFYVYPNLETERGLINLGTVRERGNNNPVEAAYAFYDAMNYKAAINELKILTQITPTDSKPKHLFFLGISYMANHQNTEAIALFKELKNKPSEFKTRSEWYLALAYLKEGQTDNAKTILKEITTQTDARSYQEKATKILDDLK